MMHDGRRGFFQKEVPEYKHHSLLISCLCLQLLIGQSEVQFNDSLDKFQVSVVW